MENIKVDIVEKDNEQNINEEKKQVDIDNFNTSIEQRVNQKCNSKYQPQNPKDIPQSDMFNLLRKKKIITNNAQINEFTSHWTEANMGAVDTVFHNECKKISYITYSSNDGGITKQDVERYCQPLNTIKWE